MTLAYIFAYLISVPSLGTSLKFYQTLGFYQIPVDESKMALLTDGKTVFFLVEDTSLHSGFLLLSTIGTDLDRTVKPWGLSWSAVHGHLLAARKALGPNGMWFYQGKEEALRLLTGAADTPPGFEPIIGPLEEVAFGVSKLKDAKKAWMALNFVPGPDHTEPYPWCVCINGNTQVGLHQTERFQGPCFTFYRPDMAEKIQKVKAAGYTPLFEMPGGNAAFRSPEGLTFLLFTREI